jgi:predicted transcriptional regulator
MIFGFAVAEVWHRLATRRQRASRSREALIAEFVDKQLWQFVSLDEWLRKATKKAKG